MTTTTLQCPTWCDAVHYDHNIHDRVVLGGATGDRFACVALEATGDGPSRIFLDVTDDGQTMSPEEALKVAKALRKAARMAQVTR